MQGLGSIAVDATTTHQQAHERGMPTSEIECRRDGCSNTFRVGGEETARCPACGTEHSAPWPHQQSDSSREADSSTEIDAPPGSSIRITIEILPGGTQE